MSKTTFWHFLAVITFLSALKKILTKTKTNKQKQKKNMKKYFFSGFYFKTHKCAFLGSTNFF